MSMCCGLISSIRQSLKLKRQQRKKTKSTSDTEKQHRIMEDTAGVRNDDDEAAGEVEEIPEDNISETEYVATGYCGLCRTQLPHNSLPLLIPRTEPWEQWEGSLRAVLCIDVENESDCVITSPFYVRSRDFDGSTTTKIKHSKFEAVNLQFKIALLDNIIAYAFHSWCYDVFTWKTGVKDPNLIYHLAKSLSHEASPWETIGTGDGWLDPPSRIQTLIGDMKDEQTIKLLPGILSRLPVELRGPIWGFVGARSAYSSFLLVTQETAALVSKLREAGTTSISLRKGDVLSADSLKLFGTSYLSELSNDRSKDEVAIKEDLTAVKLIASLPGICAMKLVGSTWESEWIGQVPRAGQMWYGTLRDPPPDIRATFTGLTCLDLMHKPPPQLMWDRPDFPANLTERFQLLDTASWLQFPSLSRFEFIRYLPLFCGKEPAKGLTFFCNFQGVIGIAAHFSKTTYFSGYRDGTPTYISLQPGEGIRNMWYRLGVGQMDAPGFVVQTTKNHTYHIGPYMSALLAPLCRWAALNTFSYTTITGLYYQNPRREIFCCAVLGKNPSPLPPHVPPQPFPTSTSPVITDGMDGENDPLPDQDEVFGTNSGNGLFFSMIKFENIVKLESCRVGKRITGLLVHYQDGRQIALGQWYVLDTYAAAQYAVLYDKPNARGEELTFLDFNIGWVNSKKIVLDVLVTIEGQERPSTETFHESKYFWPGSDIVWWYDKDYDDITFWREQTTYSIPLTHLMVLS